MSRRDEIVAVARVMVERDGLDALTMRGVAEELGIRAPSLYKHVGGRDEILTLVQASLVEEFGRLMSDARAGPSGGISAMAVAYRAWALEHPALYNLMMRHPLDRGLLPPGLESTAEAPVLAAAGDDRDTARALWAVAHGLVDLELAGRFPPDADLDGAWEAAMTAFGGTWVRR